MFSVLLEFVGDTTSQSPSVTALFKESLFEPPIEVFHCFAMEKVAPLGDGEVATVSALISELNYNLPYREVDIMFRGYNLRQKEVINITTAERLGCIRDVEINDRSGNIEAIIVPRRGTFLRWLLGGGELIIPWSSIEVVGKDIVLVRIFDTETQKLT